MGTIIVSKEIVEDLTLSVQSNSLLNDFEKLESDSKTSLSKSNTMKQKNDQMRESFEKLSAAAESSYRLSLKTKETIGQFRLQEEPVPV